MMRDETNGETIITLDIDRREKPRPLKFSVRCRILAKEVYRKLVWWFLGIYIVDLNRGSPRILDNVGLRIDLMRDRKRLFGEKEE